MVDSPETQRRLQLQTRLERILGTREVYFQASNSEKPIVYPAIVYEIDRLDSEYANNRVYSVQRRYQITVISRDPDEDAVNRVSHIPTAAFKTAFTTDNLYHTVFTIFY